MVLFGLLIYHLGAKYFFGDQVQLEVKRDDEILTKQLTLQEIPKTNGRVGLGISYSESKLIQTNPEVDVDTEDIGGPSAGLMFTLEILNQLVDEDITKGYKIAGTGEMLEDGTVGRIGGVEKKVVAAHKEGMAVFFAPNDELLCGLLPCVYPSARSRVLPFLPVGTLQYK